MVGVIRSSDGACTGRAAGRAAAGDQKRAGPSGGRRAGSSRPVLTRRRPTRRRHAGVVQPPRPGTDSSVHARAPPPGDRAGVCGGLRAFSGPLAARGPGNATCSPVGWSATTVRYWTAFAYPARSCGVGCRLIRPSEVSRARGRTRRRARLVSDHRGVCVPHVSRRWRSCSARTLRG